MSRLSVIYNHSWANAMVWISLTGQAGKAWYAWRLCNVTCASFLMNVGNHCHRGSVMTHTNGLASRKLYHFSNRGLLAFSKNGGRDDLAHLQTMQSWLRRDLWWTSIKAIKAIKWKGEWPRGSHTCKNFAGRMWARDHYASNRHIITAFTCV